MIQQIKERSKEVESKQQQAAEREAQLVEGQQQNHVREGRGREGAAGGRTGTGSRRRSTHQAEEGGHRRGESATEAAYQRAARLPVRTRAATSGQRGPVSGLGGRQGDDERRQLPSEAEDVPERRHHRQADHQGAEDTEEEDHGPEAEADTGEPAAHQSSLRRPACSG